MGSELGRMRSPEALEMDPALLDALYREHGPALRRLCRRRLGNDRDAEDASQEALLRAWSSLDRYDPSRPMWPWLATIAANVCIDLQRRAHTAESRTAPAEPPPLSPEEAALDSDHGGVVREALGQLSSSAKAVLYLRDVEGWSYKRISRFEGRTPPAVRTAVTRARHQLRTQVEVMARAQGRWPLAAIGLLWARAQRRARRIRSGANDLATRSAMLLDAPTALATSLGSAVAVPAMVSALLVVATAGAGSPPSGVHPPDGRGGVAEALISEPSLLGLDLPYKDRPTPPARAGAQPSVVPQLDLPPVVAPSMPSTPTLPPLAVVALPPVDLPVAPDVGQLERPMPARLSTAASTPSSRQAAYEMPLRPL